MSGQLKSLNRKNVRLYRRNMEKLTGELCLIVMYYAILIVLAMLTGGADLRGPKPMASVEILSTPGALQRGFNVCTALGHWGPSCVIGFSDGTSNCSAASRNFMNTWPACTTSRTGAQCSCVPTSQLATHASVQQENLAAAVVFDPTDLRNYTLHVKKMGVDASTKKLRNPKVGQGYDKWVWGSLVELLTEVNAHFVRLESGVEVEVQSTSMGTEAYEPPERKAALGNIPFYMTALALPGTCMSLVNAIAGEREKKLEQGMFMVGLKPAVYWLSWALMGVAKALITLLIGMVVLLTLLIPKTNGLILFIFFSIFLVYAIAFSLTLGAVMTTAKQTTNVLWLFCVACAGPVYANIMLFNGQSDEGIIPAPVILTLGTLLPPFSFSQALACMVIFHDEAMGGIQWHNLFTITPTRVSAGQCLLCMIAGTVIQFLLLILATGRRALAAPGMQQSAVEPANQTDPAGALDVAVSIRGLRKTFGRVNAVDGLTVDFYENQITSFLGHNGAGKSTTIQVLTGLHSPSGGDALVYGKSISREMAQVRGSIGVCPQENVLWDLLTVREHVLLFAGLRGLPEEDPAALQLLEEVGLGEKVDALAKTLSGGQQRKLQVAIALIGNPKVIFLDEPTAGMDSQARRDIWKLVGEKKKGRAIVLTTHHMDEADILGDRIAVIDAGHLQVVGTSEDLKAQFAVGHHLEVSLSEAADRAGVLSAVRAVHATTAETSVELGDLEFEADAGAAQLAAAEAKAVAATGAGDLRLLLPLAATPQLPQVLGALHQAKVQSSFGVREFGIVSTTLDDVFWRLGCQGQLSQQRAQALKGMETKAGDDPLGVPVSQMKRPGMLPMLRTLLRRRWQHEWRRPLMLVFEVLMPIVLIGLSVALLHIDFFPADNGFGDPIGLDAASALAPEAGEPSYELPLRRLNASSLDALVPRMVMGFGGSSSNLPTARDVTSTWQQQGAPCFQAWLLGVSSCTNDAKITELPKSTVSVPRVGALSFFQAATSPSVRVHYNRSVLFALPGLLTYTFDALLANPSQATALPLRPKFKHFPPMPLSPQEREMRKKLEAQILSSIAPLPMSMGLVLLPPLVVFDLVGEKASGLRHLQLLMGIRPSEYWLARFVWDMLRFSVMVCLSMIIFGTTGTDLACVETFVMLVAYLFACLPLAYFTSMFFAGETHEAGSATAKKAATGMSTLLMLGFFFSFFGYMVASLPAIELDPNLLEVLRWFGMCISPSVAFAMGIRGILMSKGYGVAALSVATTTEESWMTGSLQKVTIETAGGPLLILCLQAVLLTFLCALRELRAMKGDCMTLINCTRRMRFVLCTPCRKSRGKPQGRLVTEDIEDDDVKRERQELDAAPAGPEDAVRLVHLRKEFPPRGDEAEGTVAVADLSVRMKKGECFALLGANGAGKSTSLGMLLRFFLPSSGSAFIDGVDVSSAQSANSLFVGMGYVPQKNALFERLTGREMLEFFASVRGVPKERLAEYVRHWLTVADILEYADRRCGTYSGGNKRKLSLAIALCGDPRITVLDEPSAGVDPAARRKLWGLVNRSLAKGSTVVLTTHHMDEAGHLGQRIGIMAKGRLACLGSPLHLRTKYGGGYELAVRMNSGENVDAKVVPMIREICPTMTVREQPSSGYVKLTLGRAGVDFSLVRLYEELEKAKESSGVSSYVANQADLEDVFLRILRLSGDEPDMDESSKAEGIAAGITTLEQAAEFIKNPADKPKKEASVDQCLRVYASYRQATLGDAPAKGPCHPIENMKWKAWKGFKGMPREEAARIFVDEVKAQIMARVWSKYYKDLK